MNQKTLLLVLILAAVFSAPVYSRAKPQKHTETIESRFNRPERRSYIASPTPILDAVQRQRTPGTWRFAPVNKLKPVGSQTLQPVINTPMPIVAPSVNAEPLHEEESVPAGIVGTLLSPVKIWQSLHGTQRNLKDLQTPLRDLRLPIAELKEPISDLNYQVSTLSVPIGDLKEPLLQLQQPMIDLKQPISDLKHPLSEMKLPLEKLNSSVNKLNAPIDELGKPIEQLRAPLYAVEGGTKSLNPSLNGVSRELSSMRTPIANLSAPLTNLQSPLTKIATPLNQLGDPMAKLPKPLSELSESTASLTGEVRGLREQLGSLQKTIEGIASNISMAVVFGSFLVCVALFLHRRIPSAAAPTITTVEEIDEEILEPAAPGTKTKKKAESTHHITVMTTEPMPESEWHKSGNQSAHSVSRHHHNMHPPAPPPE